jgi:hypothetical protein
LAWHYLNYLLGLRSLGHEVFYLEDSGDEPSCVVPLDDAARPDSDGSFTFRKAHTSPDFGVRFTDSLLGSFGLEQKWGYYDAHRKLWRGPIASQVNSILEKADILLNVSNGLKLRPWHLQVPIRVLIDTDPVFTQVAHLTLPGSIESCLNHTAFYTFGENIGRRECSIPKDGVPWKPTRQPIALESWPYCVPTPDGAFTTVLSWRSYRPVEYGGVRYGQKAESFAPYLDLPKRAGCRLELALEGDSSVKEDLTRRGWQVVDGLHITADAFAYQHYVQRSLAEFSIAKEAYAVSRSGWFSERSAAYLASGRPVLVQETGFSDWLHSQQGVVSFTSPETAVEGLRSIQADYAGHCRAARLIAEEYFDAKTVLGRLLEDLARRPDPSWISASEAVQKYQELAASIRRLVGASETFILVDGNSWGISGSFAERRCLPFLEQDGQFWGNPKDDRQAIEELDRMHAAGASHIVFAQPASWALDAYPQFARCLRERHRLVWSDGLLTVFALTSQGSTTMN